MSCGQLSSVARALPVLLGRSAPLGERIQATATETSAIDTQVREGLRRLEWVCSRDPLSAKVLWFAFVTCQSVEPDQVALVFAKRAFRARLVNDSTLKGHCYRLGRKLLDDAIALWDSCPEDTLTASHRDLTGFVSEVDRIANHAVRHLEEMREETMRKRAKEAKERRMKRQRVQG